MAKITSDKTTLHHLIQTNRKVAYALVRYLCNQRHDWVAIMQFKSFVPVFLQDRYEGKRDTELARTYASMFVRRKNTVLNRGVWVQEITPDDLENVVLIDNKYFHAFFANPYDFSIWVHDMVSMLSIPPENKVKATFYWSEIDQQVTPYYGDWLAYCAHVASLPSSKNKTERELLSVGDALEKHLEDDGMV